MPDSASTPAQPSADGPRDEGVPRLARGDRDEGAAARGVVLGAARRGVCDVHDRAGEALVGDDQVAAARRDEQRLAGLVGRRGRRRSARASVSGSTHAAAGPPSRSVVWSASSSPGQHTQHRLGHAEHLLAVAGDLEGRP